MAIKVTCNNESCRKTYLVKDELKGKKIRCPNCKTVLTVGPAAQTPTAKVPPSAPREKGVIRFNCQFCHTPLKAPETAGGKNLTCSQCKRLLTIPRLSSDLILDVTPAEKQAKQRTRVRRGKGRSPDALLARAVEATMDEQGRVVGSKLHQALQRLDPSFSFRVLGHSTFTRYLEASPGVKVTRPGGAGDVTVELAETGTVPVTVPVTVTVPEVTDAGWDIRIDAAWSKRAAASGDRIPGPNAAADAAKFLGVSKLSASRYRTLQALLDASELLRGKWRRDGNTIIRR